MRGTKQVLSAPLLGTSCATSRVFARSSMSTCSAHLRIRTSLCCVRMPYGMQFAMTQLTVQPRQSRLGFNVCGHHA